MTSKIKNICFADDDPDDHFLFSLATREHFPNAALYPFFTCGELIAFLKDENEPVPEVIFLDLNMPGNRELECLQEIKRMARLLHVPVVIYSTSDNHLSIKQALALGAFKYIVKPDSLQQLRKTFTEFIEEYTRIKST